MPNIGRMKTVTLKTAKRILGKSASKFTDDELLSLINSMEVLAEIYIDTYGSKKQRGVIDSLKLKSENGN